MASWLKNLFGGGGPDEILHFKSGDDAMEYACRHMQNNLTPGELVLAMVQHIWQADSEMDDLGLYLAANPEPLKQKSHAPHSLGLKPGDLVGFRIIALRPPPAGVFGIPEVLLKPSFDTAQGRWLTDRVLFHGTS